MIQEPVARRAGLDDLADLLRVEGLCYPDPWTPQSFVAELRHPSSVTWLLEAGGRSIGHIVWRVNPDGLELLNVAVEPGSRRRGLARQLMGLLLNAAHSHASPQVFLDVRASNGGAIELYRALGFRQIGRRKAYYRVGREDAVLMKWSATREA